MDSNNIPHSTKLPRDKTFAVRSPCEYLWKKICEIWEKFAVQTKTVKSANVLVLKRFVLYGKLMNSTEIKPAQPVPAAEPKNVNKLSWAELDR